VALGFGSAAVSAGAAGALRAAAERPVAMRAGRCAERLPMTPGTSRFGFAVFFLGFSAIRFESTISSSRSAPPAPIDDEMGTS
jgi:hypothetical protein